MNDEDMNVMSAIDESGLSLDGKRKMCSCSCGTKCYQQVEVLKGLGSTV